METQRRPTRQEERPVCKGTDDESTNLRIERLRRRFTKFRREHRPRTRIPNELRAAALEALQSGEAELDVRLACGVSSIQLDQWRQSRRSRMEKGDFRGQEARVFTVLDEMPQRNVERSDGNAEGSLELRFGGWAISIRQLGA